MQNHPNLERLVDKYHAEQNRNRLRCTQKDMDRVSARLIGLIDKYDRGVLNNLQYLQNIARIATINTD